MDRKIIFYENHFIEFYQNEDEKVKSKIQYVFELIKQVERVPEKFLKHLEGTNGLFEVRIATNRTFIGYFAVLTREGWSFHLMDFKKRPKIPLRMKLRKP
jgi:hypothetical protein